MLLVISEQASILIKTIADFLLKCQIVFNFRFGKSPIYALQMNPDNYRDDATKMPQRSNAIFKKNVLTEQCKITNAIHANQLYLHLF